MKVFYDHGYGNARGLLLPYSEFKLFSDLGELSVNEDKRSRIMQEAEKLLTEDIPLLPASLYREFFVNGNRANFEQKCFRRRTMAMYLAAAEYIEGQGRFTEKLIDAVWAIMEESTWTIPAHLYNTPVHYDATLGPTFDEKDLHGLALFSACTGATLCAVYYLLKDALDAVEPVICSKIEYTVEQRCIRSYLQGEFWWTGRSGRRVDNWTPWITSNILFCTAVLERDLYMRELVAERAMQYLDNFINGYLPDGGCEEGPGYWCAAGACLFDCLELLEEMSAGKINIYGDGLIRKMGDYVYKVNITANRYVNFADGYSRVDILPSLLIRYGTKTGSDALVAFGKNQAKCVPDFVYGYSYVYRSLKCLFTSVGEAEEAPLARDSYLEDIEVMTVRQTEYGDRGMFLGCKFGHNDEFHNHNDVGNYMVYYDGKPVVIDPGVGVYTRQTFSPDRYKLWFMQSRYHNLPSFGGVDQHEGGEYRASDVIYSAQDHSLSGELRGAYPESAGILSYRREMSLADGMVIVSEDIALDTAREIVFHVMTLARPVQIDSTHIALEHGRVLTFDPSLTVRIEQTDTEGMNMDYSWSTDKMHRISFIINTDKCNVKFTIK